jgi:hypothetical protein
MDLNVNVQRACLNELTQEFRQLVIGQQSAWLEDWVGYARHQGGPVRSELPELGYVVTFTPESFAWEFKVTVGKRDPLTFTLQHDAPWRCWDTNVHGEPAVLLASDGNGASLHLSEFSDLSGEVKRNLGAYLKHFGIQIPPDGQTNFSDYR